MTITTDFAGNESTATVRSRLTAIAEYYKGSGALDAATDWGDVRTILNSVDQTIQISESELASSFRTKLNALNAGVGIIDQLSVAPVAAHSDRRLTGVSWGTDDGVLDPMRRIWRAADSMERNFSYVPETGVLDYAAIAAWLAEESSVGRVVEWFDQTGGGNHWEWPTPASAPFFLNNAGLDFRSASTTGMRMSNATLTTDWGFEIFVRATVDAGGSQMALLSLAASEASPFRYAAILAANSLGTADAAGALTRASTTTDSSTLADAFASTVEAVFSGRWPAGDNRSVRVDGDESTPETTARTIPANVRWWLGWTGVTGTALYADAAVHETFIFHTPPSSAGRLALEATW